MAVRVRDLAGGIRSLVRLLAEHGGAIEYDLLALGKHLDDLGTRRLSWRDLLLVVTHAPAGSALSREVMGIEAGWSLDHVLAAAQVNAIHSLIWVTQGDKKAKKPTPIVPPGTKSDEPQTSWNGTAAPIGDMARMLGWDTPPGTAVPDA